MKIPGVSCVSVRVSCVRGSARLRVFFRASPACVFSGRMMKALTIPLPKGSEEIFRLWREMHELNVVADVVTYNFVLKACFVSSDRFGESFGLYKQLVGAGLTPTIVTFNELMKCASRARNVSMALYCLNEMQRFNVDPDKITAHFFIVTCATVRALTRLTAAAGLPPKRTPL
jgi:pentatricopeptide repeat protein